MRFAAVSRASRAILNRDFHDFFRDFRDRAIFVTKIDIRGVARALASLGRAGSLASLAIRNLFFSFSFIFPFIIYFTYFIYYSRVHSARDAVRDIERAQKCVRQNLAKWPQVFGQVWSRPEIPDQESRNFTLILDQKSQTYRSFLRSG